MSLPLITPQQAKARVAEGARLIDIRDTDEYAREHISGAESVCGRGGHSGLEAGRAADR